VTVALGGGTHTVGIRQASTDPATSIWTASLSHQPVRHPRPRPPADQPLRRRSTDVLGAGTGVGQPGPVPAAEPPACSPGRLYLLDDTRTALLTPIRR